MMLLLTSPPPPLPTSLPPSLPPGTTGREDQESIYSDQQEQNEVQPGGEGEEQVES